ncbi:MAG: sigma-70 family RNA polymerase sigma factor, partial [Spirochaetia bacterium]|nr:sigma-70 family RNA polymerase sigma factor [Spirochaetia bacterium]
KLMKEEKSDEELCRAFVAGRAEAFDALVLRHQDLAYGLCLRMLGDREDADECAQDVFVKIHQALPRFEFRSKFTTWLYRIAMNVCKNRIDSAAFRRKKEERALPEGLDFVDSRGPEKERENKELGEILERGLAELSESDRSLVVLRDVEDVSYEEIAAALHLELGTVKSRLFRAREKLRLIVEGIMDPVPEKKKTKVKTA